MSWSMPPPGSWNHGVHQMPPVDMNMGAYTPEQWAAMQQQNWQQWNQWQQQYAQWQSQYGNKYAEQMHATSLMGTMPPLPTTSAPPPAPPPQQPPPQKPPPPPPPHENNQPLYGQPERYPVPAPVPPPKSQVPIAENKSVANPVTSIIKVGNAQNQSIVPEKQSEPVAPAANVEALQKLAEEERLFDIQFKKWEEEIEKWRRENVNHPDKHAYKEYESKFEACRAQLMERRSQMNQRKARLLGNAPQMIIPSSSSNVSQNIPPLQQHLKTNYQTTPPVAATSQNPSNNFVSNNNLQSYGNPLQNYSNIPNNKLDNLNRVQSNTLEPQKPSYESSRMFSSKNNVSDVNVQDIHDHQIEEEVQNTAESSDEINKSNFLPGSATVKGIPGLDLIIEETLPSTNPPQDVIEINDDQENPKQLSHQQAPDYSTISKGINNILGDEKIMNILSMVRSQIEPKNNNFNNDNTHNNQWTRNNLGNNQQYINNPNNNQQYINNPSSNQHYINNTSNSQQFLSHQSNNQQFINNPNNNQQYNPNNNQRNLPINKQNANSAIITQEMYQNTSRNQNFDNPRPCLLPTNQQASNFEQHQPQNVRYPLQQSRLYGSQNVVKEQIYDRNPSQIDINNSAKTGLPSLLSNVVQPPQSQQRHQNIADFSGQSENNQPNNQIQNARPFQNQPKRAPWVEEPLFTPSIVVDYEHKPLRLKARDFIEPVHMFDYNHMSKDDEYRTKIDVDFEKEAEELFSRKPRRQEIEDVEMSVSRRTRRPDAHSDLNKFARDNSKYIDRNRLRDEYRFDHLSDYHQGKSPKDHYELKRFDDKYERRLDDKYDERRFDERRFDDRRLDDRRLDDKYDDRRHDERDKYNWREDSYKDRSRDRERDRKDVKNRSRSRDRESLKRGFSKESELSTESVSKKKKDLPKPTLNATSAPLKHIVMIDDLLEPPGRDMRPEKIVIILRGPPGSGKSYLAKLIRDREAEQGGSVRIMSIDDYFMQEGVTEEKDLATGKMVKKPYLKYEYEESSEESYITSLKRAVKRTLTDGYFPFLIFDAVNDQLKSYADIWNYARQNGFQVYICTMELDPQTCFKRNIHGRTLEEIEIICTRFFPTPAHHIQLDPTTLLQSAAITDVHMEDATEDVAIEDEQETQVESVFTSKWEKMDDATQLARLDGISKPLRPSQLSMEDYLQLDDWKPATAKPGKKTVRWADIEERRKQEKMRAIGFVVGQTDWNRMTDPTMGSSALTKTKYIERVKKY